MQLSTGLRNTLADAIDTAIGSSGSARFENTGQTAVYALCTLSNPAFGAASTGVITLSGTPSDASVGTSGTATRLGFYDEPTTTGGTLLFTLSVNDTGTSQDVTISNNALASGDQVDITSLTITVPAGSLP